MPPDPRTPFDLLRQRVGLQNGGGQASDEEFDAYDAAAEKTAGRVVWHRNADYGSPVVVRWKDGTKDRGYLTCLSGDDNSSPDMDGIVHIPHTAGEKCDAGPVWMTYTDIAALPDVKRVEIGTASDV